MNLQQTQKALFQLYHNPGYRLAHRLEPKAFADVMGLSGEAADFIAMLDAAELADFADSLVGKRRRFFEASIPTAFRWVLANHLPLLREFMELYGARPFGEQESSVRNFVPFLRECSLFYDDIPRAVADVAEFELMVLAAKERQATLPAGRQRSCGPHCAPDAEFSWDTLYWKPERTTAAGFTVDPLSIVLKKSDMSQPPTPTSVVVAPSFANPHPTILRVVPVAAAVVNLMAAPMNARQVLAKCQDEAIDIPSSTIPTLLARFTSHDVIDHYCVPAPHA